MRRQDCFCEGDIMYEIKFTFRNQFLQLEFLLAYTKWRDLIANSDANFRLVPRETFHLQTN